MKVLTSGEMREVDRQTEALGIPGPILMENAGHRVVEYIAARWPILSKHRVVVLCGSGNNGGDGLVIARQLFTRFRTLSLHVASTDADANSDLLRMLRACGCPVFDSITQEMRGATLVVDAVLGTGLRGPARGKALEWIGELNSGFLNASVIAVDVPSGMNSDSGVSEGEVARADVCVTFTALKVCHVLAPNCDRTGEVVVSLIGSPASLMSDVRLHMTEPSDFAQLLQPRPPESNKGDYGHVLVVGGAAGKTGAATMAGLAALRSGAGLTTVASAASTFDVPELMAAPLPVSWQELEAITHRKRVVAIGPGLGAEPWVRDLVRDAVRECKLPLVLDADALNSMAGSDWEQGSGFRVLTPHPGEMSRLLRRSIEEIQKDRLLAARDCAAMCQATVVLKGHRTVIARPDGCAWINPTGSPALAKGGTGDVLTGLIAGMLTQWPEDRDAAVLAAIYLHGLAGQRAARDTTETFVLATDLLRYLPEAVRECARVLHRL